MIDAEAVEMMIRALTKDGSRSKARRLLNGALVIVSQHWKDRLPEECLGSAIINAMPVVETANRQVEGATYQVPRPLREPTRRSRAIRKILQYALQVGGGRVTSRSLAAAINNFTLRMEPPESPDRPTKGAMKLPTRGCYRVG